MPFGNAFAQKLMDHVHENAAVANLGDASGLQPSAAAGSIYIGLHTASPGAGGTQATNECTYTGYARKAIARSGAGWDRTAQSASNAADLTFDPCTAGSEKALWWSMGVASSGATELMTFGPLKSGTKIFTATTADVLTVPGNAFVLDEEVLIETIPGVTLPTGLSDGIYYVISPSGDTLSLSLTVGGAAVNVTAAGGGKISKSLGLQISAGITPKFLANTMVSTWG